MLINKPISIFIKLLKSSVFAFAIFFSCDTPKQPIGSSLDSDTLMPIITASFKGKASPDIFESAFHNETKVSQGDVLFEFYSIEIGKIKIESGKIIACDPIESYNALPFTQIFPLGEFPVYLAMAKTYNDERVAFTKIVFSNHEIFKWEFALQKGQKPIPLKDTSFYCYGVDAGTGMFIDSISNNLFNKKYENEWENVFVTKAEKNGYKGYMHDFEGHNLATFSSGYGDGCYSTYIGFDNQGNACQLLTDFGLVEWWRLGEQK